MLASRRKVNIVISAAETDWRWRRRWAQQHSKLLERADQPENHPRWGKTWEKKV